MSEVSTHKIVTPVEKVEVVLKDYLTGYDDEAIQDILTGGKQDVTTDNQGHKKVSFDGSIIKESQHEGLRRCIVSVGGSADDVVAAVLSMPSKDSTFVKDAVDAIVNPIEDSAEKK